MWLVMVEAQVKIEINLKDMANLQNLIKKNQMLGHDIQSHDRHSLDINVMAEEMLSLEHYDADNIVRKQVTFHVDLDIRLGFARKFNSVLK